MQTHHLLKQPITLEERSTPRHVIIDGFVQVEGTTIKQGRDEERQIDKRTRQDRQSASAAQEDELAMDTKDLTQEQRLQTMERLLKLYKEDKDDQASDVAQLYSRQQDKQATDLLPDEETI